MLPLAVTTLIQALVSMAALALPAIAPAVAEGLGTSAAHVGLYMAVVYIGAMVASLCAGHAITRYGSIRISQAGLLVSAAGLALCAVPWMPSAAAGALLVGLGYGPITPASSHLLARTTPPGRMSLVFSVKQTGVPLGGVLAGAIVPALLLALGWQGALLCVAAATAACALLAQPLRAELDADRDPGQRLAFGNLVRPMRMVLAAPALRMLAGCSFVFSLAQLSISAYLVTFLTEALAYGLVAAGLALSVAQAGGVGGRIAWGWIADRWLGARRTLVALALLMTVSALATALLAPGVPALLVLLVAAVFGASATGWNGVYLGEVARQAPAGQASAATGGTLAITFLGVVLGGPLFGGLSTAFDSYRAGFLAVAVATAACALALWRWRGLPAHGAASAITGASAPGRDAAERR